MIVSQLIERDNGSQVKIVAEEFFGAGLHRSVGFFVLYRESGAHDWKLASDQPHPDWRFMSVDDYVRFGRPEHLRVASIGEILKVGHLLSIKRKEQDSLIA